MSEVLTKKHPPATSREWERDVYIRGRVGCELSISQSDKLSEGIKIECNF